MNAIRGFLWKNLGVTLNRRTFFAISLVFFMILWSVLFVLTHNSFFLLGAVLAAGVGNIFLLGSSSRLLDWIGTDKQGRQQIEEEVAFLQLKNRARDKHFQH